jgi:hypothetical protein
MGPDVSTWQAIMQVLYNPFRGYPSQAPFRVDEVVADVLKYYICPSLV